MKITLKAARVNANIPQAEAAKKAGISTRTLNNYESGSSFPSVDVLQKLLDLYKVRYDDIIFLQTNND